MTNKENMKKIIKNSYDKKNNYTAIVEKMERKNKKINLYKYSAIPVCMVVIISLVCIFNENQNNLKSKDENNTNTNTNHFTTSSSKNNIIINDISKESEESYDMDFKIQNDVCIPYFEVLSNLNIPSDFDNKEDMRALWTKSKPNSNNYDILNNYELHLRNTKNNREFIISFSDKYKIFRCVNPFVGDYPKSTINGVELPIVKGSNYYVSAFSYNGYNFDIEGIDVTEEEFINLLESLIK